MPAIDKAMSPISKSLIIAHRGASQDAPENTLAAFDLAWQQGADGIEADFRMTRDGQIVCLHDAATGRTAGVDLKVAETSYADLRRLDIGSWKGAGWKAEFIPSLEEVLSLLPVGKRLFIELKSGPEIIKPLGRILDNSVVPSDRLRLLAFDPLLITGLKKQLPDIRACLNVDYHRSLRSPGWSPTQMEILAIMEQCGADGLSSQKNPLLDAQFIAGLHQSNKEVHVWTVDSASIAERYQNMGVDSIMTNRPGWLKSRLDRAETGV